MKTTTQTAKKQVRKAAQKPDAAPAPQRAPKTPKPAPPARVARPKPAREPVEAKTTRALSKGETIEALLRRPEGATIEQMSAATNWQGHSVRAYVTATLGKKRELPIQRTKAQGGVSVYRILAAEAV